MFSYSLYLTHELVIMQAYWLAFKNLPAMVNTFLVVTPATIIFAWLFYLFCEKPYMRKKVSSSESQVSGSELPTPMPDFSVRAPEFGVARLTLEPSAESEL